MDDSKLLKIVNSSGFPLQIGVKHLLSNPPVEWNTIAEEHPWEHHEYGYGGFIDLIVSDIEDVQRLVIECKRVRETSWIFLVKPQNKNRSQARFWVTKKKLRTIVYRGYNNGQLEPSSPQSEFCVVLGQNPKSKPMLERIAAKLVLATEALADEESHIKSAGNTKLYFPVIITTAELKICVLDPSDITVDSGMLEKATFETVPFVRFRKSLVPAPTSAAGSLTEASEHMERTVLVMNASHILNLLDSVIRVKRNYPTGLLLTQSS